MSVTLRSSSKRYTDRFQAVFCFDYLVTTFPPCFAPSPSLWLLPPVCSFDGLALFSPFFKAFLLLFTQCRFVFGRIDVVLFFTLLHSFLRLFCFSFSIFPSIFPLFLLNFPLFFSSLFFSVLWSIFPLRLVLFFLLPSHSYIYSHTFIFIFSFFLSSCSLFPSVFLPFIVVFPLL